MLGAAAGVLGAQSADEPIPCLYDWNVSFTAANAARLASDLATACADARTINWAEAIEEAERNITMASDEGLATEMAAAIVEWRKVLDQLNREKERLADLITRRSGKKPAAPRAPAKREPGARSTPAPAAPAGPPVRFTVTPGYEPWVPAYLKAQVKADAGFKSVASSVGGAARLRRGATETPLQTGAPVELQVGDVLATGPTGEINIELDGSSKLNVGTSTEIVWSKTQPCLRSFSGFPQLMRGVLTWTANGDRLRKCPKAAETRYQSVNAAGGTFTVKLGEANNRAVTTVTVRSGVVRVADMFGAETTVAAGTSRTFEQPIASSPASATDPVVAAIIGGEPVQQKDRWFVPIGPVGMWIDGGRWLLDPKDPTVPDRRTFESVDGELSGVIFYEAMVVGKDALKPMALDMAQRAVPSAKIVKEEWRTVGMLTVLYLEIEATEDGETDLSVGEYFSGAQGTAALIVQTPKENVAARRADIATLLNGLVSVSPFSLTAR
jgi:hypothetical protein